MKKSTKGTHKRLTDKERRIKRNIGVLVSLWTDTSVFEEFLDHIEIDRKTLAKYKDPYQTAMPSEDEIRCIEKYTEKVFGLPENSVKLDNENLKEQLQQHGVKFPPEIRNENIIKNNITALREYYHESKQELGDAIGVTRQAVTQYESKISKRLPEQDKLIAIAYHFNVTVDELLAGNLDQGKLRNILINDKTIMQKVFLGLLPYFDYPDDYPEEDKSKEFLEALEIHDRLYEDIGEDTPWNHIEEIDKLMHLYCQAADQGCYEAIANHLWWLMYLGCCLFSLTDDMKKNKKEILDKNTRVAELYKSSILRRLKNKGAVSESQVNRSSKNGQ